MRQKSPRPVTIRFSGSLSVAAASRKTEGLASARALDECVAVDQPAAYESRWLAASRRYRWITELATTPAKVLTKVRFSRRLAAR